MKNFFFVAILKADFGSVIEVLVWIRGSGSVSAITNPEHRFNIIWIESKIGDATQSSNPQQKNPIRYLIVLLLLYPTGVQRCGSGLI
jgi:hypothetical protein